MTNVDMLRIMTDAGEILQLCDESNDEGHGEGTYEFDVDEMKSQLGIDDIVKSVAALTELVKRKVDNSADTEVGLKRAKLGSSFSNQTTRRVGAEYKCRSKIFYYGH